MSPLARPTACFALLLGACATAPLASPGTLAPGCSARYGSPAAPLTRSLSSFPLVGTEMIGSCVFHGGRRLKWHDSSGARRRACVFVPPGASRGHPLPLLVFLQGSAFPAEPQARLAGLEQLMPTGDLTGDPQRPGFILLVPDGRDTEHGYPFPDDTGLGWDNWHRDFDRHDPDLNADAATIDHFIAELRWEGLVDPSRIYLSGWSNGSAMAILYGLNTPGIAAAAVYSAPDPFSDFDDPCPQAPLVTHALPILHVHNACDIAGICDSGPRLKRDLEKAFPSVEMSDVILDSDQRRATSCRADCERGSFKALLEGLWRHGHWPDQWTAAMLAFLRDHPLPSAATTSQQTGVRSPHSPAAAQR